ncbi:MAG: transglycosylase domain-containing protein [Bacteroidales bacterium]|nr:transglycosylase domain-containing protein [Bacteroidales bacterium]
MNNKKYIIWFWAIFATPFVMMLLIFILISRDVMGPIPTFEDLENPDNELAAEVYSEDGVLLGKFFIQNRTWTNYEEISPYMVDALIATEDIRFYRHSGIDIRGLARVFVKSLLLRDEGAGGGSTITQQLAKNQFVSRGDLSERSGLTRKVRLVFSKFKEWYTAVKLERRYTKEEIITMYLNVFDFVNNAVGIRSAAQVYFNTTPDSLNIEQSATLVGMLKNSSFYNPVRRPEATMQRRNVVMSQMVKYGYLQKEIADSLMLLPVELNFREASHTAGLATYFREYIRTTMIAYHPDSTTFGTDEAYEEAVYQWENNPLYGWCRKNHKPDGNTYNLYRDGLKIYTTINSKMQQYAEEALVNHLAQEIQPAFYDAARRFRNPPFSNEADRDKINNILEQSMRRSDRYMSMIRAGVRRDSINKVFNTPVPMRLFSYQGPVDTVMTPMDSIKYYKFFVRASFMAMDPHSGGVKAYVGGPNFNYIKYDGVTTQKRQVGSTVKPFLYTLAIQNGYSPCHEVANVPYSFDIGDTVPYTPRSSGPREYHGKMVTLKWGLAQSENYISAWVLTQFTPGAVADLMHRMGIRSYVPPYYSIFLGPADLSLEEMVGAYGTYSNKGVYTQPIYVTRIEDRNGNVVSRFTPRIDEVLTEEHAYLMTNLLMGVVQSGSGVRIRSRYQLLNQIGGKTGTTQEHSDGWFMGITPNLVAGVWAGWEDRDIHFETLTEGQGANMALPIYAEFLKRVYADPEFSLMQEDVFEPPTGFNLELDCEKLKSQRTGTNVYRRY